MLVNKLMIADFNSMPEFIDVKQLAQLLGISIPTVYRIKDSGDITFHQIGANIRFRKKDIEEYLNKNCVKSAY